MEEYDYRPVGAEAGELRAVAELFAVVWPAARHLTVDYVRWLYADNPSGQVIGFNAWSGGTLAGHYVVVPIRAAIHGQAVPAALSLNTAVHPAHQGKGLFTTLAQQTYELARSRGVHHVIGVANANSTPGFVRKLEFQLLRRLEARVLWRAPTLAPAGEYADCSWRRIWEPNDLCWRLRNPATRYAAAVRRGCRQILASTGKHGIQAILKLDDASGAAELRDVPLAPPPCCRLRLWIGASRRVRFAAAGGMTVPERFRASPLNLIIRYLVPGTPPVTADAVEFEAIDFDAY